MIELIEGRRVRLTQTINSAQAGQTGYLHLTRKGGSWGVVFDAEADFDMMTTHVSDDTPEGKRVQLVDVVEPITDEPAAIPLEEGRRVQLSQPVIVDDVVYAQGETGYLHCWCIEPEPCTDESNWGVVFDRDGEQAATIILGMALDWQTVRLIDVVELIILPGEEVGAITPGPSCPTCGSHQIDLYFGSSLGDKICDACGNIFTHGNAAVSA